MITNLKSRSDGAQNDISSICNRTYTVNSIVVKRLIIRFRRWHSGSWIFSKALEEDGSFDAFVAFCRTLNRSMRSWI